MAIFQNREIIAKNIFEFFAAEFMLIFLSVKLEVFIRINTFYKASTLQECYILCTERKNTVTKVETIFSILYRYDLEHTPAPCQFKIT